MQAKKCGTSREGGSLVRLAEAWLGTGIRPAGCWKIRDVKQPLRKAPLSYPSLQNPHDDRDPSRLPSGHSAAIDFQIGKGRTTRRPQFNAIRMHFIEFAINGHAYSVRQKTIDEAVIFLVQVDSFGA
jgi:hypothetical protein